MSARCNTQTTLQVRPGLQRFILAALEQATDYVLYLLGTCWQMPLTVPLLLAMEPERMRQSVTAVPACMTGRGVREASGIGHGRLVQKPRGRIM